MSILQLYFLGALDIRYDNQPLPKPPTLKSQSLLAYLILHRHRPQPRDRLVGLFWGDRPERKARRSLSTALWHIRRCLPDEIPILSDPHTAQFDPQSDLWLDVDEFESHISHHDIGSLQSAVALYRGDFLDGFYDDWIINERYRLETLFLDALARLMVGHEATGEQQAALSTALRLLGRDPLREDAHRATMRAYCHLGQRNAALEQYYRCREIVLEELGAEPMAETTELYQAILEGRFKVGPLPEILAVEMPAIGPAGRSPLDVIAPVKLVGREQEMAFLHQCWQGAQAGRGGLALISGEAGVGKTRLVEEFANRLRWQGIRVLWGRCYEFERALPYQPIAEALRTVVPALASDELADFPAWTLREVARLVPEVLERRPGLEVTPAIRSDQERARLFDGVARFLAELCPHGALLVVLEDLHWASQSTLQLIHYLARHLADHRVLMAGTFRPEAISLQHPLLDLRRQLTREGLAKPLRLSRLSPEVVEAMVVEMSGAGKAVMPLAKRLYQETEGNPFFLMEIVKTLFDTGVIHLEGGAWRGDFVRISEVTLPLPAAVSEAIQARANRLEENAQDALRLAAVLGREFDFELLNAVWERGEETTLEALDDLLRHRLIDEGTGAMGRDYAFTHHKIQEVVYAGMSRRRRQHAHARAGAAIETLYGPEVEALASELAFHFEQGRQLDKTLTKKAIMYLLQAGEQAAAAFANAEAVAYLSRALELTPRTDHAERYAFLLAREKVYDLQGEREAQGRDLAALGQLAEALDSGERRAEVALRQAYYASATGDYPAAIAAAKQAIALAQEAGVLESEATGYVRWGVALMQQGDYAAARVQLEEALRLAQAAGLRRVETDSLNALTRVAAWQGHYARARDYCEQTLPLYHEIGDRRGEGTVLNTLGFYCNRAGDYAGARRYLEQALALRREIGDRPGEVFSLANLGEVSLISGDYAGAKACYEQALALCREIADRRGEGWALIELGAVSLWTGDFAGARGYLEQGLTLCRKIGSRDLESIALVFLALLFHRLGDDEAAREHSQQTLHIVQDMGARFEEGMALIVMGHSLVGLGHLEEAATTYGTAQDLWQEMGHLSLAMESLASLARVCLAQGDLSQAQTQVEDILSYLETNTLEGAIEPFRVYLTCYRVLKANQHPRAQEILTTAHNLLQEHVGNTTDEEMRRSFLENVPAHRELVREWAKGA